MLNTFKQVIQYESSKLCNYDFLKIKLVDEKHIKQAKRLILSKFSNISNNFEIRYKYTHSCGKSSFIEMENKECSCSYMFDHGICAHLIRIALIEEISLPGMEGHTRLISKQREKTKKINEKIIESDQEFEENLNAIEQQATQLPATTHVQATATSSQSNPIEQTEKIAPKKGEERKRRLYHMLWKSLLKLNKIKI